MRFLHLWLLLLAVKSYAVPLDTISTFCMLYQEQCQKGTTSLLAARGIGTDVYYVLEVDPATGAIPVSGSIVASNPSVGPTGDPVPADATYIAGINPSGDLQGVAVEADGSLNVNTTLTADFGAGNATSQTLRTVIATDQSSIPSRTQDGSGNAIGSKSIDGTAPTSDTATANYLKVMSMPYAFNADNGRLDPLQISSAGDLYVAALITNPAGADIDFNYGTPGAATIRTASMLGVGSTAVSAANPVPITPGTGATFVVSNLPATVDTNLGAPGASTVRTAAMLGVGSTAVSNSNPVPVTAISSAGKAYATSVRNVYSSTNVTTGAWVELIASTPAAISAITLFDSSGQTLELGTGGSGAETRVMIIPPGGIDGQMALTIASGTRVSIRAVSATANSGEIDITGYN